MKKNLNQREIPIEIFEGKKPAITHTSTQPIINKITNSNFIKNNKQTITQNNNSKTMLTKIKQSRTTGIINISDMNLEKLPSEIFDENINFDDINWWQMVDITKIDATTNKISDVIENFSNLPSLNYLKFSNNLFKTIPNSIYNLNLLKYLDFSNNKLTNLSDSIRNLSSLVELNLSNNEFSILTEEIVYLKNLEVFNISNNKLTILPKNIGNLKKMKKIDCSVNNIEFIKVNIGQLTLLEELSMHKNKIKEIEKSALEPLINLKIIDLHINNLTSFTNIPYSDKLHTINLSYNKIEVIDNLSNCANLNDLDVNNNKLTNFPMDILCLKHLKTLNICNNSINDLPSELCFLKELVRLYIEGNPLKKLNSKLRGANAEVIKNYLRTKLSDEELMQNDPLTNSASNQQQTITNLLQFYMNKTLKINNAKLESIPQDICRLNRDLNTLDLSNNNISDCSALDSLKEDISDINLSFNKMMAKHLPISILYFNTLRNLDLKNNLLDSFFEDQFNSMIYGKNNSQGVLVNLEYLDLSLNRLTSIPLILSLTKKMRTLILSNNEIKSIDIISKYDCFQYIDTLDLGNNKIGVLPENIDNCIPNIKNLNLENNELKSIPTELGFLRISKLVISGNPLKQIRFNVISGGTNTILDYLKKMHKGVYSVKEDDSVQTSTNPISINNQGKTLIENNIIKNDSLNKSKINKNNANPIIEKGITLNLLYNENVDYDIVSLNQKILEVEYDLQNAGNNMNKKQEIRRKLNELIRLRANLLK